LRIANGCIAVGLRTTSRPTPLESTSAQHVDCRPLVFIDSIIAPASKPAMVDG
jgi:hypothetical protein